MLKYTNNEYHMGGPFFVLVLLFSSVINILEIILSQLPTHFWDINLENIYYLCHKPSNKMEAGLISSGMILELSVPFEFRDEEAFEDKEL